MCLLFLLKNLIYYLLLVFIFFAYFIKSKFNNVSFENGMIMTIEDYVTPSDWHTFISVYVNDEMSMVGLLEVQFEDGTKISLKITEYVWN